MKILFSTVLATSILFGVSAQKNKIDYVEYDLDNGLHVILHEDHSTPIVAVSIMYHVGSKNEDTDRTGFAHFFEHLMFEGSENIGRGEYSKFIEKNGGALNAYTSQDKTFYFENFSSNNLELGLWLESERLLHAKVDQVGIETQREVVKEEKRQRIDNQPYGSFMGNAFERLFKEHPYRWMPIGSMEHLDAAQEEDYIKFYQTFYVPANATLSIAGDINIKEAKELINKYFGSIPKGQAINLYRDFLALDNAEFKERYGKDKSIFNQEDFFKTTSKEGRAMIAEYAKKATIIPRPTVVEKKLDREIIETIEDNIQLPGVFMAYQAPAMNSKDAYSLEMLNEIISGGSSSRMNKKIVEEKQLAVAAFSFMFPLEDPGALLVAAIANKDVDVEELKNALDEEINKAKTELVSEKEFQKVKNKLENDMISSYSTVAGIAEGLANYHIFYKNTSLINNQLSVYENITREDLLEVAKKYFTQDARVVLYYVPKED
ncbi:MAG TPA: pitrilysin family protein [Brumimicrobium sp.]|nr:pitrilysin family protein [Brumimicrobium sp.]